MDRIEDVEIKLAFMEKQVLELNDVVRELGDAVADLTREVRQMREQQERDALAGTGHEKPPHY